MKFRLLNRWRALLCGYFWIACPLCREMFGGHEWKEYPDKSGSVKKGKDLSACICPDCTKKGLGN